MINPFFLFFCFIVMFGLFHVGSFVALGAYVLFATGFTKGNEMKFLIENHLFRFFVCFCFEMLGVVGTVLYFVGV